MLRAAFVLAFLAHVPSLCAQAAWTRVYPSGPPSPRSSCVAAFDSARGRMLVFGGNIAGPTVDELWLWDGTAWSVSGAAVRPPARYASAMAFDDSRARGVLFGGRNAGDMSDTWEWNGNAWSQSSTAIHPPARYDHAMAYDPLRHVVLLFGGFGTSPVGAYLSDLWQWDGQVWQQRTGVGPTGRDGAALAFDPSRGEMLLFGGANATQFLDETWTWNGTSWQQLFPATPVSPRMWTAMVTDIARSRVVLLGGWPLQDPFAWEWDGTNWHQQLVSSPGARMMCALAYDSVRRQVVVFGGALPAYANALPMNDTWLYRTPNPALATPYGQGCSGSAGTPALSAAPYSLPWLGDIFRTRIGTLPATSAGAVFVTGLASTPGQSLSGLGFPGCQSFVTLDSARFVLASGGMAEWSLQVPVDSSLVGVSLFQQGFVFDAGAAGGAVVSNALSFTAGVR
jgi:hypothetical protein